LGSEVQIQGFMYTDLDDLWVYRFYGSLLVFKLFKLLQFTLYQTLLTPPLSFFLDFDRAPTLGPHWLNLLIGCLTPL